jgi:hypothetical protein
LKNWAGLAQSVAEEEKGQMGEPAKTFFTSRNETRSHKPAELTAEQN